jgi:hypothetical protein
MSLPRFQIVVLSPVTGLVTAFFDATAVYDLKYSRILNDVGMLAMTLPSTQEIRDAFVLDAFIEIYRTAMNPVLHRETLYLEETYLTRFTHQYVEEGTEKFAVGGVSLNHLLMRRVIDPDDDPLVSGGFSTKAGLASTVIWEFVNEQCGPGASAVRRTPGMSMAADPALGANIGRRLRYEKLFDQIQLMAKEGVVDFEIHRNGSTLTEFRVGTIGHDKTEVAHLFVDEPFTMLSTDRGNLTNPSLQYDRRGEANFVYELGQGQQENRIVAKVAGTGITDSIFNRCEFTDDARNVLKSDVPGLLSAAQAVLADRRAKREFSFRPSGREAGFNYRIDWDLGDALSVRWGTLDLALRVLSIEVSADSQGETIDATIGNEYGWIFGM